MTWCEAITPIDIRQSFRPAKLRFIDRINTSNRVHCADINHVGCPKRDEDWIVAKIVRILRITLLYRNARRGLHLTFEKVLLLHRVAAEYGFLADGDESHASHIFRAYGVDNWVVLWHSVYLYICHVWLVHVWDVLEKSVVLKVPESNRSIAVPTQEIESILMDIHWCYPTALCTRWVHERHHLLLSLHVKDSYDALVVTNEHEVLKQPNALTHAIELVFLLLQFACDQLIIFVEQ